MAYPGATIFQITEGRIESVAYETTEHFQVTRQFLNHPERMLSELLDERG
jgi:predicted ATPase